MRVALIRHAATESSLERRLLGRDADEGLSIDGRAEAHRLAEELAGVLESGVTGCVATSQLRRAVETGRVVSRRLQVTSRAFAGFDERAFGLWTRKTLAEVEERNPELSERFVSNPLEVDPPGAEAIRGFRQRVLAAWQDAVAWSKGSDVLLLISHDGPIRVLLEAFDPSVQPARLYDLRNCAVTWIEVGRTPTVQEARA